MADGPVDGGYTDPSGLSIIEQTAQVPDAAVDAYAAALSIAQNQPDDFGYPKIADGAVVLPAVSTAATTLTKAERKAAAKQLREYAKKQKKDAAAPAYDPSAETTEKINVAAAPGKRTARQLDELKHTIIDARDEPSLKGGQIVMTGIDASGRVVVTVKKLAPGFASSLVKKFGKDDIVVQVEPDFVTPELLYSRDADTIRYGGGCG